MDHLLPEGENLRAAVRFIAERRKSEKTDPGAGLVVLVDEACIRFDLTPSEGEFLLRFVKESDA